MGMKKFIVAVCACMVTFGVSQSFAASSKAELVNRLNDAAGVIKEIESIPADSIPKSIMASAQCVAVVPNYLKAAFIFGGSYGQGVVTCRTPDGWSAPAFIKIYGGSWGLQIGAEATDLVLIAVNHKGMADLLKSNFKIGASAAAAAGPVGRDAAVATNLTMQSELLSYSRSQGVFAGINLNGAVVKQNTGDTRSFYGHTIPFKQILTGKVPVPSSGANFVSTVAKYFHKAR